MDNKVKNIYYYDEETEWYATWLYIEMEDWRIFKWLSTDSIMPFERVKELPWV